MQLYAQITPEHDYNYIDYSIKNNAILFSGKRNKKHIVIPRHIHKYL